VDARAKVEAVGWDGLAVGGEGFRRCEETAQTAAEVGGAGEVGLGGGVGTAEGEDAGGSGDGAKKFVGALGEELGAMVKLELGEGRGHRMNFRRVEA
jgi:hypothetical protein